MRNCICLRSQCIKKTLTGSPIADVKKEDTIEFSVPLNNNTAQSKLYSKFFVGMKFRDGTYQALSDGCFITNPEALAENQSSYPQARSKKGASHRYCFWNRY